MTEIDILSAALCAWKEARGDGIQGMQAVISVLLNRSKASGESIYAEVYRPLQFTSMSYQHDPQLLKQPSPGDWLWKAARTLSVSASTGLLEDNTDGATSYYAMSMDAHPPSWARNMVQAVVIGHQRFFRN